MTTAKTTAPPYTVGQRVWVYSRNRRLLPEYPMPATVIKVGRKLVTTRDDGQYGYERTFRIESGAANSIAAAVRPRPPRTARPPGRHPPRHPPHTRRADLLMATTRMMHDQKGWFARVHDNGQVDNLSCAPGDGELTYPLVEITDPRSRKLADLLDRNRGSHGLRPGTSVFVGQPRWEATS